MFLFHSLDAKSTNIIITVKAGGLKYLQVRYVLRYVTIFLSLISKKIIYYLYTPPWMPWFTNKTGVKASTENK